MGDAEYIFEQSKVIEEMLTKVPGTIDIWSNWYNPVTRLNIDIDQQLAQRAGVSSTDVARSLSNYVSGQPVSEFRDGDEVFPIVTRALADERTDLGRLNSMPVFSPGLAESVPLSQIAEVKSQGGFGFIHREDLIRTVTVEARNLLISPEDMAPLLQPKIDALNAQLAPDTLGSSTGLLKIRKLAEPPCLQAFPCTSA